MPHTTCIIPHAYQPCGSESIHLMPHLSTHATSIHSFHIYPLITILYGCQGKCMRVSRRTCHACLAARATRAFTYLRTRTNFCPRSTKHGMTLMYEEIFYMYMQQMLNKLYMWPLPIDWALTRDHIVTAHYTMSCNKHHARRRDLVNVSSIVMLTSSASLRLPHEHDKGFFLIHQDIHQDIDRLDV